MECTVVVLQSLSFEMYSSGVTVIVIWNVRDCWEHSGWTWEIDKKKRVTLNNKKLIKNWHPNIIQNREMFQHSMPSASLVTEKFPEWEFPHEVWFASYIFCSHNLLFFSWLFLPAIIWTSSPAAWDGYTCLLPWEKLHQNANFSGKFSEAHVFFLPLIWFIPDQL